MNISILTIGDEICIGQVVNTNAAWIAGQLSEIGCRVFHHSVIGDDREIMLSELNRLEMISDVVIITGGLGPTHDDITKPVLCEYFNDSMVENQETLKNVEMIFSLRNMTPTNRNKAQALVPAKAKVLINALGTAPGLRFSENGIIIYALPGVPYEMKYLMQEYIIPELKEKIMNGDFDVMIYKTLITTGIPESTLADRIGNPEEFLEGASLAFLPSYGGVRLRLSVKSKSFKSGQEKINKIENIIRARAGDFIFGVNDQTISSVVAGMLKSEKLTVSVAESCTGGLLGGALTEFPGSSQYFTGGIIAYSNEIKIQQLGVKKSTLENYGAVSEQTAVEMAENVRKIFKTDFGLSVTGIAGPDGGSDEKPLGTTWIGLSDGEVTVAQKYRFSSDRLVNRERAVATALANLLKKIKSK